MEKIECHKVKFMGLKNDNFIITIDVSNDVPFSDELSIGKLSDHKRTRFGYTIT